MKMKGKPKDKKGGKSVGKHGVAAKTKLKKRKKKVCIFCADKRGIDYKDLSFVRKFVSDRGKILTRRSSGCCALHQRMVAGAIKRSRDAGLLHYTVE